MKDAQASNWVVEIADATYRLRSQGLQQGLYVISQGI